jgi:hypothetical protein
LEKRPISKKPRRDNCFCYERSAWLKEDFGKRSVKLEKGKEGEEGKVNKLDELFNIISHLILIYCSKL